MGLFYEVLSAINNPNQQGSIDQLSTLTNAVQQLAGDHGLDASTTQSVLSALGGVLGPALQQQGTTLGGTQQLANLVNQFAGGNPLGNILSQVTGGQSSLGALQSLIPPQMQQQIIQGITQKTGVNAQAIQGMLPALLPVVMNLLNMGASKSGGQGSNPILSAFLDGDRDGDTDLGDMMQFANRFLNAAYKPT